MNSAVKGRDGKTVRAAIYTRVSSEDQIEGTSLETQLQKCQQLAELNGWTVSGEYVDGGVSGTRDSRPELDRLMKDCQSGKVDAIVVYAVDRFARSLRVLLTTLETVLDPLGVAFVSVNPGGMDYSSDHGRAMLQMMGSFAELDRKNIIRRMATGQRARVAQGLWPGGQVPYGIKTVPNPNGSGVVAAINEDEAAIVHQLVVWLVDEGLSTGDIAARLNAQGVKPRKAQRWTYFIVRRLLENPNLNGSYVWGKGRSRYGVVGSTGKYGAPAPVVMPKVLDDETFALVAAALDGKRLGPRAINRTYALSKGILWSPCGSPMHGAWRADRASREYWCPSGKRTPDNPDRCHCPRVKADDVEWACWAEVIRLLESPELMQRLAAEHLALAAPANDQVARLAEVQKRIAKIDRKLDIEVDKALEAGVDVAVLKRLTDRLAVERSDLEAILESLEASVAETDQALSAAEHLAVLAAKGRRAMDDMPLEDKAAVFRLMQMRVEVVVEPNSKVWKLKMSGRMPYAALAGLLATGRRQEMNVGSRPGEPRRR